MVDSKEDYEFYLFLLQQCAMCLLNQYPRLQLRQLQKYGIAKQKTERLKIGLIVEKNN